MIQEQLTNILGDHVSRIVEIKELGSGCYKITMPGIQFKIKADEKWWFNSIVKTQLNTYQGNAIIGVLDRHFLTELELIEKKIQAINWDYQMIDDGATYRNNANYYKYVRNLVVNAEDRDAAEKIWNQYKNK